MKPTLDRNKRKALLIALVTSVLLLPIATQAETVQVTVRNLEFEPREVTISPGDTVEWVWENGKHTVTSGLSSEEKDEPGKMFRSVFENADASLSYTFDEAGEFPYFCETHEFANMKGKVIVEDADASEASPTGSSEEHAKSDDAGDR